MPQTIIITGASDGIGAAAARQLATQGERVIVVGRSPEKTAAVAREIDAPYHTADFAELAQVRRLASELLAAYPRIDVLANNAGGLFRKGTTTDGFDKTFQVNHLGGFLLTHLLLDRLLEAKAKVIQTSSIGAKFMFGHIVLDDFVAKTAKNPFKAYGDTKLANQLFTKELARRYGGQGLSAVAFHPGNIASSFGDRSYGVVKALMHSPLRHMLETSEDGGARLAWLAQGTPGVTWQSGAYYEDNKIPLAWKINRQTEDAALARDLWSRSETVLGLPHRPRPIL